MDLFFRRVFLIAASLLLSHVTLAVEGEKCGQCMLTLFSLHQSGTPQEQRVCLKVQEDGSYFADEKMLFSDGYNARIQLRYEPKPKLGDFPLLKSWIYLQEGEKILAQHKAFSSENHLWFNNLDFVKSLLGFMTERARIRIEVENPENYTRAMAAGYGLDIEKAFAEGKIPEAPWMLIGGCDIEN